MENWKKYAVVGLIVVIILAAVLGIFLYNKEHGVDKTSKKEEETIEISKFKEKLEENELKVENEEDFVNASEIGAVEGKRYTINGLAIYVYKFDTKSSEELTVSNIKKAKEEGKVILPSFDNYEFNVYYNKGLILANYEDHPDKDKIIEIFKNL